MKDTKDTKKMTPDKFVELIKSLPSKYRIESMGGKDEAWWCSLSWALNGGGVLMTFCTCIEYKKKSWYMDEELFENWESIRKELSQWRTE